MNYWYLLEVQSLGRTEYYNIKFTIGSPGVEKKNFYSIEYT